ncbi:MAG: hypothetical protein JSW46_00385 [Gemmatimonadota bacterium]|nr:MAG: hypothetical protein JSW46_00385 [Gemmatimonadota bacterium]
MGPDLPMGLDLRKEQWRVNWRTRRFELDYDKYYRIQVMLGSWVVGYRDVDPVSGDSPGACKDEVFCKFDYGNTIPINVRIEVFAGCPDTRCQTKSFNLDEETDFEVEYSEGRRILLNIPDQDDDQDVTMSFGVCNEAQEERVDDLIDLPTFGPCAFTNILNTEQEWDGVLEPGKTATVSFCDLPHPDFGLDPPQQADLLRVHAFHDDGTVESLREKELCSEGLGSLPTNPFLKFASRVRDQFSSWIGVRPLMASAAVVQGGARGGDSLRRLGTEFKLALGGKIDFYDTPNPRTAPVGSSLTTAARVTDLEGNPVENATVRWNVVQPPAEGATVAGSITSSCTQDTPSNPDEIACFTDEFGTSEVSWTLAIDPGVNKLTAGGRGIADPRDDQDLACSIEGEPSRCNGPRENTADVTYEFGSFDPFTPIAVDDSPDDTVDVEAEEGADTIPDGTRLLFTAIGSSLAPDQVNDPVGGPSSWCPEPGSLYQSFTPSLSPLAAVELRMRAGGSFPSEGVDMTVKIRGDIPTGTDLGIATAFVPGPQTTGAQPLVLLEFSPAIAVTTGSTYVIEWPSLDGSVLGWIGADGVAGSGGPYDGGTAFGCSKNPIADRDWNFTTFSYWGE